MRMSAMISVIGKKNNGFIFTQDLSPGLAERNWQRCAGLHFIITSAVDIGGRYGTRLHAGLFGEVSQLCRVTAWVKVLLLFRQAYLSVRVQ